MAYVFKLACYSTENERYLGEIEGEPSLEILKQAQQQYNEYNISVRSNKVFKRKTKGDNLTGRYMKVFDEPVFIY